MKRINSESLSNLPREVKDLVRSGVYSLYTVSISSAEYVLVTNRGESYFLNLQGAIVAGIAADNLNTVIVDVVAFSDPATDGAMINCV